MHRLIADEVVRTRHVDLARDAIDMPARGNEDAAETLLNGTMREPATRSARERYLGRERIACKLKKLAILDVEALDLGLEGLSQAPAAATCAIMAVLQSPAPLLRRQPAPLPLPLSPLLPRA